MEAQAMDLPSDIEAAFAHDDATATFDALMPAYCSAVAADRCFLYLRDASTGRGGTVACWSEDGRWPDMRGEFVPEPADLFTLDPMMGIAARQPEALFIDDIETAGPEVLNLEFEQRDFGHRALIHAPVYADGELVGILEPCTFGEPHAWSAADRELTAAVQERLGPVAGAWLQAEPR
jgi:GAF domain-containing protein